MMKKTDFLVIGSGIAGLIYALTASKNGSVIIATKANIDDSNTKYAQGGIAGATKTKSDKLKHINDTLIAGANHNKKKSVEFTVNKAWEAIEFLKKLGVPFETNKSKLKLSIEGGHSNKRITFVGDYTGKAIEETLIKEIKKKKNIKILEKTFAHNLIIKNKNCYGATFIRTNKQEDIFAGTTILATGGIGQIYKKTTNPKIATGDGLAMGINAGTTIKDIEFIQFHPTALNKPSSPLFLISESLRGEGGKLINDKGEYFMKNKHKLKDLAPRDIVSKTIFEEQKTGKVFLDIRNKDKKFLKNRFPQIYKTLKNHKIEMGKDLIPITPAAHYLCGGIHTNLNGETNIKNLLAIGEVAHTGLHGANRLASNSLLEGAVFALNSKKTIKKSKTIETKKLKIIKANEAEKKQIKKWIRLIQETMWKYGSIVKSLEDIKKIALPKIKNIVEEINNTNGTNEQFKTVRNMAINAKKILETAKKRKSTLGTHFIETN